MADVAEVDDARDPPVVVEQHVVERHVAVHDVRAQVRPSRQDPCVVTVEDVGDERAPLRVAERAEKRPQLRRVLQVPQQLAGRRRMEEAAQREIQPRVCCRVVVDGAVVERRSLWPSVQALEHPHVVRAVRPFDGRGASDARPRDGQARIDA